MVTARLARIAGAPWRALRSALRTGGRWAAEILTSYAIIGGWALLTAGLVDLCPSRASAIWKLSLGALLISLSGWKFVWTLVSTGLYALTRGAKRG